MTLCQPPSQPDWLDEGRGSDSISYFKVQSIECMSYIDQPRYIFLLVARLCHAAVLPPNEHAVFRQVLEFLSDGSRQKTLCFEFLHTDASLQLQVLETKRLLFLWLSWVCLHRIVASFCLSDRQRDESSLSFRKMFLVVHKEGCIHPLYCLPDAQRI